MLPICHFLIYGWREGRDPCSEFSVLFYLNENEDIRYSNNNPFVHWVLHGEREGRLGKPITKSGIPEDLGDIDWAQYSREDYLEIEPYFDAEYYFSQYPEVAQLKCDPIVHFLKVGWRLGFNPSSSFTTNYYLNRYPDVQSGRINPFVHYCRSGADEERETKSYIERILASNFRPLISVIIPNYNHAKFLRQRLCSILEQTYRNLEIIFLDDASTDESIQEIESLEREFCVSIKKVYNKENSGSPFRQWRKGIEMAEGGIIWICESDDFCEKDFLERLVPSFADKSVNIAFGKIQFCDEHGEFLEGLDDFRRRSEEVDWNEKLLRPAADWFSGALGVNNVIANVGGCLLRKQELSEEIWRQAESYRICGDWFLYLHFSGAGQISFNPHAVSYFRQHEKNTSASNFRKIFYYDEIMSLPKEISSIWRIPKKTAVKFYENVQVQYNHFHIEQDYGDFRARYKFEDVWNFGESKLHVQILFLGFLAGGGELFPINLANALREKGVLVSLVAMSFEEVNRDIEDRLHSGIPVYGAIDFCRLGRKQFLKSAQVSVLHSHVATADAFLYSLSRDDLECPLLVTLHGSYVGLEHADPSMIEWIYDQVDQFVYTAERNLEFFQQRALGTESFKKLHNAMPKDPRTAKFSKSDFGICEGDVVFTFVARGIRRKGWLAVIRAMHWLNLEELDTNYHVLMIGDGDVAFEARSLAKELGVTQAFFLGFQSEINGILRMSDCMLLPSRFEGESYPLCLIQALQEGVPAIVTDIGETRRMITCNNGNVAGILLREERNSMDFAFSLFQGMKKMFDRHYLQCCKDTASYCADRYDISNLANEYLDIYLSALSEDDLCD